MKAAHHFQNPFIVAVSATLVLCSLLFAAPLFADEPSGKKASDLRNFAYGKSGEWLYESLSKINIPGLRPPRSGDKTPLLPVDWKSQALDNKKGFPLFKPSALDYHEGSTSATALLAGFRTKFHSAGPKLFDDYFLSVPGSKWLTPKQKKEILDHKTILRERSMVFYLSYDLKDVQPIYYPGKLRFEGGARSGVKKWLPGTPKEIKEGKRTDQGLIQSSQGLLGIFNGTFDTIDNFARWSDHEPMRYGGFGYDSKVLMEPQPEMATFAQYEDGHIALGTYSKLPNKVRLKTFIQNRFMVIENGALIADSDPNAYCSFYDDIARSYLFTDKNGRVGYLWSIYTPANVLAKLALGMGVKDMMLLDIHSPVSCVLSDAASPLQYGDYQDYMRHSHDWVPNFFRLSPLKRTLTWISAAINSRIQTHYVMEAFKGGTEAYFALFLKGSPEARRARGSRADSASRTTR